MDPIFSILIVIGFAIVMLTLSGDVVLMFMIFTAAVSQSRMARMMMRAGVSTGVARHVANEAIMRDARSRCRSCESVDLCERWLDETVAGDNGFCPNAQTFRTMRAAAGPTVRDKTARRPEWQQTPG